MNPLILIIALVPAAALLGYLALLAITSRHGLERPVDRFFAAFLAAMMVWSLGALMMYVDRQDAAAWNKVMMGGVSAMPVVFYGFAQSFLGHEGRDRWLLIGGAVSAAMVVLNALGLLVLDLVVTETGLIAYRFGPAMPAFGAYYLGYVGLAAAAMVPTLRRTREYVARNRIRYLLVGLAVITAGGFTNVIPAAGALPVDIAANLLNAVFLAYAISRYQLLDLRLVVRKGLLYFLPTAVIAAGYLVIVYLSVNVLHLVGTYQVLMAVIVGIAVAVALQPVHEWAQAWVDRRFFREKHDAGQMLKRLSRTVASVLDLERLAGLILDEICGTIHISKAALLLLERNRAQYELMAERGLGGAAPLTITLNSPIVRWLANRSEILTRRDLAVEPQFKALWARERAEMEAAEIELLVGLQVGSDLVGILALGPKRSELPYTPDEHLTLMTLAGQTAVAVQNAWLYSTALEEKERAETILQRAFAGIMVLDQQLRVVALNASAEEIAGRSIDELRGRRLDEVLGPALLAEGQPLGRVLRTGQPVDPVEVTLPGLGMARDVLLGVTPLREGYLLNFADITHFKEVDRLKSEIVANVSHELRGPLASIKGYAELLLDGVDGGDPALRTRFLTVIDEETNRLAGVVDQLLDLSRMESGRIELRLAPVSVRDLIEDVTRSLEVQVRQAEVRLHVDAPEELPAILADRNLLHAAMKNLVSNAVKFSHRGGPVEVVARAGEGRIVVDVIDRGIGIPPEEQAQIFTKFYRGAEARRAGIAGTGLGLVLAKGAIERHGGTISVESEPGHGTRFTVSLPAPAEGAGQAQPAGEVQERQVI